MEDVRGAKVRARMCSNHSSSLSRPKRCGEPGSRKAAAALGSRLRGNDERDGQRGDPGRIAVRLPGLLPLLLEDAGQDLLHVSVIPCGHFATPLDPIRFR